MGSDGGVEDDLGRRTGATLALTAAALSVAGRFGRRAALRGATSAAAVAGAGLLVRRMRGVAGSGATSTAAAAAFATGAALELPAVAAPLVAAATVPAVIGVRAGRPAHLAMVAAGSGVAVALLSRRPWPVAPHEPAEARPQLRRTEIEPRPDGGGVTFVVNGAAGPALSGDSAAAASDRFPGARVVDVDEGGDLRAVLAEVGTAEGTAALGISGGDGSVRAAATTALELDMPLVVVPSGTLNHLARDLGLRDIDDAVAAVHDGEVVEIDVAELDGRPFLNTAAFGAYPDLVDARERLESTIGKWPAMVVALARVLRGAEPLDLELDGERRRVWMVFVGNCRYHPSGFAPGWRERLDDGELDVRIVDATRPQARTRLLLAVLSGRLGRSQVYEQRIAQSLTVRSLDGPLRVALDGEAMDGPAEFVVRKCPQRLRVFVPRA